MIWHIFCKDWRLLRWPVIALAVVQIGASVMYFFIRSAGMTLTIVQTLRVVTSIGGALLVVALVHQDVIPGDRQDWLTRPIRRGNLLTAKLVFVALALQGPKFLADLLEGLGTGLSLPASLSMAVERGAWLFVAFVIPWLACSSVLANPVQMVGLSFLLAIFTQLASTSNEFLNSGMEWMASALIAAVVFVIAGGGLVLTYLSRRVTTTQLLLFPLFFLPFGTAHVPWAGGFAVQQRLSAAPGAARDIALTPLPDAIEDKKERILVSGLGPDALLHVDKVGRNNDLNQAPFWRDRGQAFLLHDLRRGRGAVDYYMTLLEVASVETFPATGGSHGVPGVGRCTSRINFENTAVQLDCLEDAKMPSCYTLTLEHIPSGTRNPEVNQCVPDYSPYPDLLVRHNLSGHITQVTFRQNEGNIHYPVNEGMLPDSRLVMRIYKARDHFMRRLTF
jgi:hypothetical protein